MSDPLTPNDLAAMRESHVLDEMLDLKGYGQHCADCDDEWPCPVVRLLDEVERLRKVECDHLWYLTGTPPNHAIHCVNCGATTGQSEAPTVSDGGKE